MFFPFPLDLLRYNSSKGHGNTGKITSVIYSKSALQSEASTTSGRQLSWQEGDQTGRLMEHSETGSEVLEVSWDGLQGGFCAAFHIDVLKWRQKEAQLSNCHDSSGSQDFGEKLSSELQNNS